MSLQNGFESKHLERRFRQHLEMSGGRFLVSLQEVLAKENISLYIREKINFLKKGI